MSLPKHCRPGRSKSCNRLSSPPIDFGPSSLPPVFNLLKWPSKIVCVRKFALIPKHFLDSSNLFFPLHFFFQIWWAAMTALRQNFSIEEKFSGCVGLMIASKRTASKSLNLFFIHPDSIIFDCVTFAPTSQKGIKWKVVIPFGTYLMPKAVTHAMFSPVWPFPPDFPASRGAEFAELIIQSTPNGPRQAT